MGMTLELASLYETSIPHSSGCTLSLEGFKVHQPLYTVGLLWHLISSPQLDNADHEFATKTTWLPYPSFGFGMNEY
ncbi:hypothetical protein TNCV_3438421 [Trichonephila clavipes]|nr:hypothetical protein TNCV_3438421 [Trichonephila clavipes]